MNINFKEAWAKINSLNTQTIIAWLKTIERKTWMIVAAGLAGGILMYVFVVSPAWFQRPLLKKKVGDVEIQMVRLKALLPRKPELIKRKSETKAFIAEFQKKLFREDEMAFLLGRISQLARESQVEVLSSKPMERSEPFPAPYAERYKKFIYLITVEGGYHQIAELVSKLESNDQCFQIQSLVIVPQPATDSRSIADIKLMAVSHVGDIAGA